MPRIKNPEIDGRDELLKIIMIDVLEQKIFMPKQILTLKERSEYLSRLADENQLKLASSELRNRLFKPYMEKQPVRLSKNYGITLSVLLLRISKAFDLIEYEENIQQFQNRFEIAPDALSQTRDTKEIIQHLYGNRHSLLKLINSEWLIAERIGDKETLKNGRWGIAIGKMKFLPGNGYVIVETVFKFGNSYRNYSGIASHDIKSDYIFIDQVAGDETKRRSNIIVRMADMDYDHQTILLGHFTYHSKAYSHLLSKTICMYKISKDVDEESLPDIGDHYFDKNKNTDYWKIPTPIRQFLYQREKNRMSLPKNIISSETDLEDFLMEKRYSKIQRVIRKHITGEFYVYYKRKGRVIVEDVLEINYDEDAVAVKCRFMHKPDVNERNTKTYLGTVDFNQRQNAIILEMSNERARYTYEDEDPILLCFLLPDDTITFSDAECFQGIITGLQDAIKGPISQKCLIVNKNKVKEFTRKDDPRLKTIFENEFPELTMNVGASFNLKDFSFFDSPQGN